MAADRELSPWGGRDGVVASELSHTGLTCGAVPRSGITLAKKPGSGPELAHAALFMAGCAGGRALRSR